MEAIVCCHALKNIPCTNCKLLKALRWAGGGKSSWQDMICIECGATYEIKTKASMEKVETALKHNRIQGGSFRAWCELINSQPTTIKRYLVILPRTFTYKSMQEKGKKFFLMILCSPRG